MIHLMKVSRNNINLNNHTTSEKKNSRILLNSVNFLKKNQACPTPGWLPNITTAQQHYPACPTPQPCLPYITTMPAHLVPAPSPLPPSPSPPHISAQSSRNTGKKLCSEITGRRLMAYWGSYWNQLMIGVNMKSLQSSSQYATGRPTIRYLFFFCGRELEHKMKYVNKLGRTP